MRINQVLDMHIIANAGRATASVNDSRSLPGGDGKNVTAESHTSDATIAGASRVVR